MHPCRLLRPLIPLKQHYNAPDRTRRRVARRACYAEEHRHALALRRRAAGTGPRHLALRAMAAWMRERICGRCSSVRERRSLAVYLSYVTLTSARLTTNDCTAELVAREHDRQLPRARPCPPRGVDRHLGDVCRDRLRAGHAARPRIRETIAIREPRAKLPSDQASYRASMCRNDAIPTSWLGDQLYE